MKRVLVSIAFVVFGVVSSHAATKTYVNDNNASCDLGTYPAATLLLPYFEVDFESPATKAVNTIFTVINTSRNPQIVRVTIWSDWGYPAASFPIFLTGYDAQTISLYETLAKGNFPGTTSASKPGGYSADNDANPAFDPAACLYAGGSAPFEYLARMRRVLTQGVRDEPDCRVGEIHRHATGYVTIDVVNTCASISPLDPVYWREVIQYDNVLTGDYERINPDQESGNYAGGSPLVHIRAIPDGPRGTLTSLPYTFYDRYTPADAKKIDRRQPLPSAFAARWIEGGTGDFRTQLAMWREGTVGAVREECPYGANGKLALSGASIVRFDEHENAVAMSAKDVTLPLSSATSVSNTAVFPPLATSDLAGWIWINFTAAGAARPAQSWVIVQMYAEGRYDVDYDATALANGCTPNVPATP